MSNVNEPKGRGDGLEGCYGSKSSGRGVSGEREREKTRREEKGGEEKRIEREEIERVWREREKKRIERRESGEMERRERRESRERERESAAGVSGERLLVDGTDLKQQAPICHLFERISCAKT